MNRTAQSASFAPGPLLLTGLIVVAALTRLLPHPPNFSPVEAIALFGGAYFASRKWALLVPLAPSGLDRRYSEPIPKPVSPHCSLLCPPSPIPPVPPNPSHEQTCSGRSRRRPRP